MNCDSKIGSKYTFEDTYLGTNVAEYCVIDEGDCCVVYDEAEERKKEEMAQILKNAYTHNYVEGQEVIVLKGLMQVSPVKSAREPLPSTSSASSSTSVSGFTYSTGTS